MHDMDMFAREFDVPMDLTDTTTPGAAAPGPRLTTKDAVMLAGLDGKSARRMATAALVARMSDKEVWRALDAANKVALLAMEAGNYAVGQRAVEQQQALTRELRRRTEERR